MHAKTQGKCYSPSEKEITMLAPKGKWLAINQTSETGVYKTLSIAIRSLIKYSVINNNAYKSVSPRTDPAKESIRIQNGPHFPRTNQILVVRGVCL